MNPRIASQEVVTNQLSSLRFEIEWNSVYKSIL